MASKNLLVSLIIAVALSSCVEKDDGIGRNGAPRLTRPVSDADGTWSSDCSDWSAPGYPFSVKTRYTIASGTADMAVMQYSDASCTAMTRLTVQKATFATGSAVTDPAGAKECDFNTKSVTVTLYTDDGVSKANEGDHKICSGGFTKGQAKAFTAADCASDGLFKELFGESFRIYKVDGNKLYLGGCGDAGTPTDCSSATKRPTTLFSAKYAYTKE